MKDESIHPCEIPLWWNHLDWMEENEQEVLTLLLQEGKLQEHLDNTVFRAIDTEHKLRERWLHKHEAQEIVMADIIAPEPEPRMDLFPPMLSPEAREQLQAFRKRFEDYIEYET